MDKKLLLIHFWKRECLSILVISLETMLLFLFIMIFLATILLLLFIMIFTAAEGVVVIDF